MLYKYTKLNEKFFENRMLRFTQPHNFNDPFEGQVNNFDLLRQYEKLEFHIPEMSNHILERGLKSNNIGVLSLSMNKCNLLMWSHYADEYKGMLIEFNPSFILTEKLIEFGEKKTVFASVEYNDSRLKGELWGANINGIPVALGRKNKQWEEEKEIRVFCHKDNIDEKVSIKSEPLDDKSYNLIQMRDMLKKAVEDEYDDDTYLIKAKDNLDAFIASLEDFDENISYMNEEEIWLKKINKSAISSIIIGPLADRSKALEYYLRGVLSETLSGKTKLYFAVLNPSEYRLDYVELSETKEMIRVLEPDFSFISSIDMTLKWEFPTDNFDIDSFDIDDDYEESETYEEMLARLLSPEYLSTYNKIMSFM